MLVVCAENDPEIGERLAGFREALWRGLPLMGTDSSTDSRDLFITLVHGTWARGIFPPMREKGTWFADGSDFRKNLASALSKHGLSFRMCSFLWSGANSVRERDQAARELAEHVRAKQVDYPGSTQVVIAHSHGGNIALRAVDKLEVTRDENVFIATIATPFVEILQTKLSSKELDRIASSIGVIMLMLYLFVIIDIFHIFPPSGIVQWIILILLSIVGMLFFVFFVFKLNAKRTAKLNELCKLTSLSGSVRQHPLLILRALDDEASLSLAAAAIGNRLSALITSWSRRILLTGFMLIAAPLVPFAFGSVTFGVFGLEFPYSAVFESYVEEFSLDPRSYPWVVLFSYLLWGTFVVGVIAFLVAPGVFKSAYGKELLFNSEGCQINSQSAPDSIDQQSEFPFTSERASWATVVTLHRADSVRRGLRHGLYDDPQCAELIAAWVAVNRGRPQRVTTRDLAHLHPESHGQGSRPRRLANTARPRRRGDRVD